MAYFRLLKTQGMRQVLAFLKMGKEDKDKDVNLHLDGNTITNILKKMKLWFQGNF